MVDGCEIDSRWGEFCLFREFQHQIVSNGRKCVEIRVTQFRKLQSVQHSVQRFLGTVKVSKKLLNRWFHSANGAEATQQR
jgi:hypothetical protein